MVQVYCLLRLIALSFIFLRESRYLTFNFSTLHSGTCIVDPKSGEAIYTRFNVNCSQWIDTELPLTYEVAHFNDILTTVVCRHHSPDCQTILPMASNDNLILYIRVRIIDNMGMFSEVYVNVSVRRNLYCLIKHVHLYTESQVY